MVNIYTIGYENCIRCFRESWRLQDGLSEPTHCSRRVNSLPPVAFIITIQIFRFLSLGEGKKIIHMSLCKHIVELAELC